MSCLRSHKGNVLFSSFKLLKGVLSDLFNPNNADPGPWCSRVSHVRYGHMAAGRGKPRLVWALVHVPVAPCLTQLPANTWDDPSAWSTATYKGDLSDLIRGFRLWSGREVWPSFSYLCPFGSEPLDGRLTSLSLSLCNPAFQVKINKSF